MNSSLVSLDRVSSLICSVLHSVLERRRLTGGRSLPSEDFNCNLKLNMRLVEEFLQTGFYSNIHVKKNNETEHQHHRTMLNYFSKPTVS